MVRIQSVLCILLLPFLAGITPPAVAQESDADIAIVYAERVPLAAQSLMLDVVDVQGRLVAVGERGNIILSDDRGETWQQAQEVPTRSTLTSVVAVDGRLWAAGHDTVILSSTDGGNTWASQNFDPDRQQPIMDLYFSDAENGMAIGAYGLMLVTTDGGQTWDDWAVNDEDDMHLNAIIETPQGNLLIAGEAGFGYRSTDGGETWETLDLPYGGSMFGAFVLGNDCAVFYGLRGHAMMSCDDGVSWEELDTGTQTTMLGGVVTGDNAIIVGNSGSVHEFNPDTGFKTRIHSSGVDFSSAIAIEPGRYLLVGEDGAHFYPEEASRGMQP